MTRQQGNPIQIIQGGQYGSEAKGAVAVHYVMKNRIDIAVRTGATNAGHTVYRNGERFVMQQLPVGWVRPETSLVIGAGALVDPEILQREIKEIYDRTGEDIRSRLLVDPRAYLHWRWAAKKSSESGRHALIGATGKGCSEALIARLQDRGKDNHTIGAQADKLGLDLNLTDTEKYLNDSWDAGARIQLEGTQGQLLDLYLGPYPYTTHKQTGPAQWLSECGMSPALPLDIVMVVRTMPIRVAGNSGPLLNEMSWPYLVRWMNDRRQQYDLPPLVSEAALEEFDHAVRHAASLFALPPGSDGTNQHLWTAEQRVTYRDALSNLNAAAIAELSSETRAEVAKVFEMTTVTKKLRRIAEMEFEDLERAGRQIRPSRVALTFFNYWFPQRWCTTDPIEDEHERTMLKQVEDHCGAPVEIVNRGPLPEHFIETNTGHSQIPIRWTGSATLAQVKDLG